MNQEQRDLPCDALQCLCVLMRTRTLVIHGCALEELLVFDLVYGSSNMKRNLSTRNLYM